VFSSGKKMSGRHRDGKTYNTVTEIIDIDTEKNPLKDNSWKIKFSKYSVLKLIKTVFMENKIFLENLDRKKKAIRTYSSGLSYTIKTRKHTASTKQNRKFVVVEKTMEKRNGNACRFTSISIMGWRRCTLDLDHV
jgi:hypothetical protein